MTANRRPAPRRIGRYEIGTLLGSGGMADVYRGIDPELGRAVALKLLRDCDEDQIERFMREARAQAHVEHPHIGKVYEVGIADGRPFIAMQCIEGMTLAQAAYRMPLEAKIAVMADVAEAVHAAHRVGLVHRDLKPGNIMLEETEDGRWHAYVLDFGLARDQTSSQLTTVGVVMGTPSYMAPEQARGDRQRVDRRTDVYGLGATMYELLTRRPPFEAETSVAILLKLIEIDAVPPRVIDSSIPADLETVAMKCLEKDPQRRYDSARALADDLRRYLNGEPIAARRTSTLYKLRVRARRHPTMTALLGAAAIAVIGSTTLAVMTSHRTAEVARAAQRFGQEVARIDAVARYSRMLPLHDVNREHAIIRRTMTTIDRERRAIGGVANGPAEYAIGRGHLALEEFDASRQHLEAAWRAGYRTSEVAQSLGRAIGEQYQRELAEAERIRSRDAREAQRKKIEHDYRDVALQYLRQGYGSGGDWALYGEALIAYYGKDYDLALAKARSAFAAIPWLFEAKRLEGDVLLAKGIRAFDGGHYDDARLHYAAAGDAYALAHAIAPSDARVLLGDAERWFRTLQIADNSGGDPRDAMQHAIATAEAAARTGTGVDASLRARGLVFLRIGEWQLQQGIEPEALDSCIAIATQALQRDARNAKAYSLIGAALFSKARYAATHGQDPFALYDASIANQRRAVELLPRDPQSLLNLGNALRRKAEAMEARGQDGSALVDESITDYDRAVAVVPEWANAFNDRSLAFLQRGEWQMAKGIDPLHALADAAWSAEHATKLNPSLAAAFVNLSNAHFDRGARLLQLGRDPRAEAESGAAAAVRASALNPKLAAAHVNAASSLVLGAQYCATSGACDPQSWIDRTVAESQRAIAIDPKHASAYPPIATAYLSAARDAESHGRDATAALRDARAAIARADALDPNNSDTLTTRAEIELTAGDRRAAQSLVARALVLNPENRDAAALRRKLP